MATELLFVPCGWLEEFEPSDTLRPKQKNKRKRKKKGLVISSKYHSKIPPIIIASEHL